MGTRENLQLTTQMLSEMSGIDKTVKNLMQKVFMPIGLQLKSIGTLTPDLIKNIHSATTQLNTFKVRLENIFGETDIKVKVHQQLSRKHLKNSCHIIYLRLMNLN